MEESMRVPAPNIYRASCIGGKNPRADCGAVFGAGHVNESTYRNSSRARQAIDHAFGRAVSIRSRRNDVAT